MKKYDELGQVEKERLTDFAEYLFGSEMQHWMMIYKLMELVRWDYVEGDFPYPFNGEVGDYVDEVLFEADKWLNENEPSDTDNTNNVIRDEEE